MPTEADKGKSLQVQGWGLEKELDPRKSSMTCEVAR